MVDMSHIKIETIPCEWNGWCRDTCHYKKLQMVTEYNDLDIAVRENIFPHPNNDHCIYFSSENLGRSESNLYNK